MCDGRVYRQAAPGILSTAGILSPLAPLVAQMTATSVLVWLPVAAAGMARLCMTVLYSQERRTRPCWVAAWLPGTIAYAVVRPARPSLKSKASLLQC